MSSTPTIFLGGVVETQSSNEERTTGNDVTDSVTVFVRMSNAVRHLKEPDEIKVSIHKVYTDILEPYMETSDSSLCQKYGDHLTDVNAVSVLARLLHVCTYLLCLRQYFLILVVFRFFSRIEISSHVVPRISHCQSQRVTFLP